MLRRLFIFNITLAAILLIVRADVSTSAQIDSSIRAAISMLVQDAALHPMQDETTVDSGGTIQFGQSIEMDGDRMAVSDFGKGNWPTSGSGVVYVYDRVGGVWGFGGRIIDGTARSLGGRLALSDNTILATARNPVDSVPDRLIYAFRRQDTPDWQREAILEAPDSDGYDNPFGEQILIEGNTAAIARRHGPVYIFERTGSQWAFLQTLPGSTTTGYELGKIDIDGGRIVVAPSSAEVMIYERTDSVWAVSQWINMAAVLPNDSPALNLSLDDNQLAVGVPGFEPSGDYKDEEKGAVVVLRNNGGTWTQEVTLSGAYWHGAFGSDVTLSGNLLIVTLPNRGVDIYGMYAGVWYKTADFPYGYNHPVAGSGAAIAAVTSTYNPQQVSLYRYVGFGIGSPIDLEMGLGVGVPLPITLTLLSSAQGVVNVDISVDGACVLEGLAEGQPLRLTFTDAAPSQSFVVVPDASVPPDALCDIDGTIVTALTDDAVYRQMGSFKVAVLGVYDGQAPTWTPSPNNEPALPSATRTQTETLVLSPTPSVTMSYTPTLTPSTTSDPCTFLEAPAPALSGTDQGADGGKSSAPRTTPCPPTHTPTITPTYTPTSTPTDTRTHTATRTPTITPTYTPSRTPSMTFDPCAPWTPMAGITPTGDAGGDRNEPWTTPCSATYTPTFTPSQTPTETPTLTPSLTDLPSLTPESTLTSEPRQPVQLLANPDFDHPANRLMNWSVNHLPAARIDDKAKTDDMLDVFMFKGGKEEKSKLKQLIWGGSTPFQLGDSLHLYVSYRNKGPQPDVRIKLTFKYGDGTPASIVKIPMTELTDSYRTLSAVLPIASIKANEITVTLTNKSPKKKTRVFIDRVELWWMPAP